MKFPVLGKDTGIHFATDRKCQIKTLGIIRETFTGKEANSESYEIQHFRHRQLIFL